MSVELDGMKLVEHVRDTATGATKELRSVYNLSVSEKRSIVEHKIPGLEGGILQDLGRNPIRISFDGIIYGETAKDDLEKIRARYKAGTPVPFSSDISGVAEVIQILIEALHVTDRGGTTGKYEYSLALREYIEPPASQPPPSQGPAAQAAVQQATATALGSANYITGKVLDAQGNPQQGVDVKITWNQGEYKLKTDAAGVYRKDKLEPGTYTVTVDAEGYEGLEKEVIVKSGKEKAEIKEKEAEEEEPEGAEEKGAEEKETEKEGVEEGPEE